MSAPNNITGLKPVNLSQTLSRVPFKIEMFVNNLPLSTGTAFVYRFEDKNYLVTNWHNVSGRSPFDFQPLSTETGGIPTKLGLKLPVESEGPANTKLVKWTGWQIDLYEDTANYSGPVWWEHPKFGPDVDLVAIELNGLEKTSVLSANDEAHKLEKLSVWAGTDVFILGFPIGISGGGGLPIWKRGSIASEPDVDLTGLPMFYVDTATRRGMSGSPVYAQASGFWPVEGKPFPEDGFLGTGYRFLGIYSGRTAVDGGKGDKLPDKLEKEIFEAQLGKIWKEQAIVETISAKRAGVSSWGLGPKKVAG